LLVELGPLDDGGGGPPATAGALRQAVAAASGRPAAETLAAVTARADVWCQEASTEVKEKMDRMMAQAVELMRQGQARERDTRLLQKSPLDRVVRYEAHVRRELKQALGLLRELQAERLAREAVERAAQVVAGAPATRAAPESAPRRAAARAGADRRGSFGNLEPEEEEAAGRGVPLGEAPRAGDGVEEFIRQFLNGRVNGAAVGDQNRDR
jgi:hypothetical protein